MLNVVELALMAVLAPIFAVHRNNRGPSQDLGQHINERILSQDINQRISRL